ncbi:MAG TPA: fatty acid desaturase [Rhizomicrobium sp.]
MRNSSSAAINLLFLALVAGAAALVFGGAVLLPWSVGGAIALVALAALTAPLHWGLLHEAIHGKLFANEAANRIAGRALGVFLLFNFDVMRFAHLYHHRENRHSRDRPEDIGEGGSRLRAAPAFFFTLLGGQELGAMAAPLAVLPPLSVTRWAMDKLFCDPDSAKLKAAMARVFTDPERRARIRIDFVFAIAFAALALWLWGAHWYVFAACVAVRFVVLSLLDNAPHYGTALDSGLEAKNTTLHPSLRWLVLNSNFHGVHHRLPHIGWRELPANFTALQGRYTESWLGMVLRQFRGPMHVPAHDRNAAATTDA